MRKKEISEAEIIQTIKNGDFQHFDELVNRYSGYVLRVSLKMIKQAEDAEDCLQETFLKLFKSLKNYQADSKFTTWLYKITVNTCLDKMRQVGKLKEQAGIDADWTDAASQASVNPEKAMLTKELRQIIEKAIASLPEQNQQTIILTDMQKLSYEHAAREMGLSLAAFKSRLFRSRKIIQQRLNDYIYKARV